MPSVNPGESRDDYVSRCIPIVIDEGTTDDNKQAAAICHSMWNKHAAEKERQDTAALTRQLNAITWAARAQKQHGGWLVTRKQMEVLCPGCAGEMGNLGIEQLDVLKLKQMPAPLKSGLCAKFGDDEGFFGRCMKSSLGDFDPEQENFCAWLHHECIGTWPGEKESKETGGVTVNLPPIELSSSGETRLLDRFTATLKQMLPWLQRTKQESLDALRERIWRAFDSQYNRNIGGPVMAASTSNWITDTYPDHVIVSSGDKYYRAPYTDDGSTVTFAPIMEWMEVERKQEWVDKVAAMKQAALKGEKHPWHTGVPGQRGGSGSSGGGSAGEGRAGEGSSSGGGEDGDAGGAAIESVYRQSDRLVKMGPAKRAVLISELAKESSTNLKKMGQWVLGMQTATTDRSIKRNLNEMKDMLISALDAQSSKDKEYKASLGEPVQPSDDEARKLLALFKKLLDELETEKAGARHSKADNDMIQGIHDQAVHLGAECPMVMKQVDGQWRWVTLSSNAYEDTDREVVSRKALAQDVEFSDLLGNYGTLDWWHVPALALGVCDFRALQGDVLVESGTFHDNRVGEAISHKANDLQVSLTFYHPHDEPDAQGVFSNIRTSARALLPRGRAANLLTAVPAVTEKESIMASVDLKDKYQEFTTLLGDEALVKSVVEGAEAVEKKAREMGLRRKQAAGTAAPTEPGTQTTTAKLDEKGVDGAKSQGDDTQAAFATALKEALSPFVQRMQAIEDALAKQAAKEAGASEANAAKVVEANKQIAEHQKAISALAATVKELTGEQPRGVKGYQASADPATVLAAIKEGDTQPQLNPMDDFMKALGIGQGVMPVAQPGATQ